LSFRRRESRPKSSRAIRGPENWPVRACLRPSGLAQSSTHYSEPVRRGLATIAVLGLALAPASAPSARSSRPTLTLSRTSGPSGTRVEVVAHSCTKPYKSPDTLAWHDHYYWLHDAEKRPPLGVWRRIHVVRTSSITAQAVFIVRQSDHVGRGLLDLFCEGNGNATAIFTVTR
jgi:hypothetical protein